MTDGASEPVVPEVITSIPRQYSRALRRFQGIPSVERAPNGRLWATWYGGGD